jgi:anti-sigma regulatory factor (Ser/Thr protein kinase)
MSQLVHDPVETFTRALPPRLEALPPLRSALREWLRQLGVPQRAADDIVLATWEVCANAIEHPVRDTPHDVELEAKALPRGIRVAVRDAGRWTGRVVRANRGMGLRLVEGLVDRLSIRRGLGETEVVLFRRTAFHRVGLPPAGHM